MHRGIGQEAAQTTDDTASTTCADERPACPSTAAIQPIGVVQIFPRSLDTSPRAWVINSSLKIGRRAQSPIQLEDDRVSRDHASLELEGSGLRVFDLHSRHGTFVDGIRAGGFDAIVARPRAGRPRPPNPQ
jgi:pSer/pThr/pTyr-binding forkhead associated (FHA) protein